MSYTVYSLIVLCQVNNNESHVIRIRIRLLLSFPCFHQAILQVFTFTKMICKQIQWIHVVKWWNNSSKKEINTK